MSQFGTINSMEAEDALFSKTTQRIIYVLFGQDEVEDLTYAEILRRTAGGAGAIHRELRRLVAAGLVLERGSPLHRVFVANTRHPIYPELRAIAKKLLGAQNGRRSEKRLDPIAARTFAKKYMWWQKPEEVVGNQERLVAQIMSLGTFDEVRFVEKQLGEQYLRRVVKNASPGNFDRRSWVYWNYRLNLASPGRVPPPPERRFA